ncbi:unnamed protein product [Trichobilharzia regenti]|nr:unnamed protein product [Trichobilharzia regenti]
MPAPLGADNTEKELIMSREALGRSKRQDKEWLSTYAYLAANRGEEDSEREDDSLQRLTTEGEAEFNVHCTE